MESDELTAPTHSRVEALRAHLRRLSSSYLGATNLREAAATPALSKSPTGVTFPMGMSATTTVKAPQPIRSSSSSLSLAEDVVDRVESPPPPPPVASALDRPESPLAATLDAAAAAAQRDNTGSMMNASSPSSMSTPPPPTLLLEGHPLERPPSTSLAPSALVSKGALKTAARALVQPGMSASLAENHAERVEALVGQLLDLAEAQVNETRDQLQAEKVLRALAERTPFAASPSSPAARRPSVPSSSSSSSSADDPLGSVRSLCASLPNVDAATLSPTMASLPGSMAVLRAPSAEPPFELPSPGRRNQGHDPPRHVASGPAVVVRNAMRRSQSLSALPRFTTGYTMTSSVAGHRPTTDEPPDDSDDNEAAALYRRSGIGSSSGGGVAVRIGSAFVDRCVVEEHYERMMREIEELRARCHTMEQLYEETLAAKARLFFEKEMLSTELENLTAALFDEANKMVAAEAKLRAELQASNAQLSSELAHTMSGIKAITDKSAARRTARHVAPRAATPATPTTTSTPSFARPMSRPMRRMSSLSTATPRTASPLGRRVSYEQDDDDEDDEGDNDEGDDVKVPRHPWSPYAERVPKDEGDGEHEEEHEKEEEDHDDDDDDDRRLYGGYGDYGVGKREKMSITQPLASGSWSSFGDRNSITVDRPRRRTRPNPTPSPTVGIGCSAHIHDAEDMGVPSPPRRRGQQMASEIPFDDMHVSFAME